MIKILIADDSIVMRTILQYMIENCGHTVIGTVNSGDQIVDSCIANNPDVLFIDALLKGLNISTVIGEIKAINPNIKIILVSEQNQIIGEKEVQEAGANRVVNKPFVLQQVLEVLELSTDNESRFYL